MIAALHTQLRSRQLLPPAVRLHCRPAPGGAQPVPGGWRCLQATGRPPSHCAGGCPAGGARPRPKARPLAVSSVPATGVGDAEQHLGQHPSVAARAVGAALGCIAHYCPASPLIGVAGLGTGVLGVRQGLFNAGAWLCPVGLAAGST